MPNKKQLNPIYVCPDCKGTGLGYDKKCRNCQGLGAVLVLDGRVPGGSKELFYWGEKLSYLKIIQKRNERKLRVLINALFFIFGFVGFLSLIKVLYDLQAANIELYNFIYARNEYSLVWWISVLANMYLVYRINRESKVKFLIKKKPVLEIAGQDALHGFNWDEISKYKKTDISKSFDQASRQVIEDAWLLTDRLKHLNLENIHLFTSLLSDSQVNMVFARLEVDYKKLSDKVKRVLKQIMETGKPHLSLDASRVFLGAYLQAYNQRKNRVSTTDLLYSVTYYEGIVKEMLYELDIGEREIAHVVEWVDLQRWLIKKWREFRYRAKFKPKSVMNRTYTAIATPNLDAISRDMTLWARAGAYEACIDRHKEIREIFRVLEADKLGAILVGSPGVGKRTIIEGIAQLMVKEEVPKIFQDKRLVSLLVSGLIAGASRAGEMEQRVITVMNEVAKSENIILFIEDIHHMIGVSTGEGETMDVAEVLAEQMQGNNFLVLATTTPEYYKKHIEKSSLAKTMQKIFINEPDLDESISILESKALMIEGKHKVYFSYQAIEQLIKLSERYLHDTYLPEKAIKALEEVALSVKQKRGEKSVVNAEDVAEVVSNLTNIPVTKITAGETKKLLNLEERMHERIIGQDEAVKLVASALRRARTELRKEDKPIASFLFLGPTGVGKTEVAKTLARIYFGDQRNMIRVDMSEYQASDALAKLIGDARTNTGGYLTEAVRKAPFSLVLLDEIEKATPDILNIFLQVLDDGRLTDATGKTIDFTNAIIIGTSNAGTNYIQESIKQGKKVEQIRNDLINKKLKEFFRPEFLNRFDGIVVFRPLEINQVEEIGKIFLERLRGQLEEKGVEFEVEQAAVSELAKLGFDPTLGARPLRRVIQDRVEDGLARLFLEKKIDRRDKVILKGGLELEVIKAERI